MSMTICPTTARLFSTRGTVREESSHMHDSTVLIELCRVSGTRAKLNNGGLGTSRLAGVTDDEHEEVEQAAQSLRNVADGLVDHCRSERLKKAGGQ